MDRAFQSGASASAPTPPASPSIGYPTEGNPGTGTPPTKPGDYWYHMITEELRALVEAAGLTPSQNDLTQLLQALPGALASRPEMARSLAANGYQKLPGGLILQWGTDLANGVGPTTITLPIAFPTLNAAVVPVASVLGGTGYVSVDTKSLTNFVVRKSGTNFGSFWIAVGY